jgi:hypothetical protein
LSRSTPCLLLSYPCITGSINAAAYKGNLFFDPSTCKSFAFLRPHLRDFPYLTLTWSRWNFSFIMVWLTQKWSWFWDPLQGLAPRGPLSLGTNQDGEVSEIKFPCRCCLFIILVSASSCAASVITSITKIRWLISTLD